MEMKNMGLDMQGITNDDYLGKMTLGILELQNLWFIRHLRVLSFKILYKRKNMSELMNKQMNLELKKINS